MKQVTADTISKMSDAEVLKLLGNMRDIPISSKRKVWKSLGTVIDIESRFRGIPRKPSAGQPW